MREGGQCTTFAKSEACSASNSSSLYSLGEKIPVLLSREISGKLRYVSGIVLALMDRIDPYNLLGLLDRPDVEINHDGFVVAAHEDTFERLILARIDFLVRHERRHID